MEDAGGSGQRLELTKVLMSSLGFVLVKKNICKSISICRYVVSVYPTVNWPVQHIHYNEFQAVNNVDELVDI